MSEIEGYVLCDIKNEETLALMTGEFIEDAEVKINEDSYYILSVRADKVIDLYINASEYADTKELLKYILEKYSPNILVSSFENKAFVNGERVSRKNAFSALSNLSPTVGFSLNIDYSNFKEAHKIISNGEVNLNDISSGIPNYERCFFGEYAPLMEYAVDRGYHDYYCLCDQSFPNHKSKDHILHRLINTSDLDLVEKALKLGADPNGLSSSGTGNLLHYIDDYLIHDYNFDVIDLINLCALYGADFNLRDSSNRTPLINLSSQVERNLEYQPEKMTTLPNVIEALINNGASVDVYDSYGAGLLVYFSNFEEAKKVILKLSPNLKPYTDNFDFDGFLRYQTNIYNEKNFNQSCDEYYYSCIRYGFVEFLLSEEQIKIIKGLTEKQLFRVFLAICTSPQAPKILNGFHKNGLPITVSQTYESGRTPEDIGQFSYDSNEALVKFYDDWKDEKYRKLSVNHHRYGSFSDTYEIVDNC